MRHGCRPARLVRGRAQGLGTPTAAAPAAWADGPPGVAAEPTAAGAAAGHVALRLCQDRLPGTKVSIMPAIAFASYDITVSADSALYYVLMIMRQELWLLSTLIQSAHGRTEHGVELCILAD